jgi:hypothetical protein
VAVVAMAGVVAAFAPELQTHRTVIETSSSMPVKEGDSHKSHLVDLLSTSGTPS